MYLLKTRTFCSICIMPLSHLRKVSSCLGMSFMAAFSPSSGLIQGTNISFGWSAFLGFQKKSYRMFHIMGLSGCPMIRFRLNISARDLSMTFLLHPLERHMLAPALIISDANFTACVRRWLSISLCKSTFYLLELISELWGNTLGPCK